MENSEKIAELDHGMKEQKVRNFMANNPYDKKLHTDEFGNKYKVLLYDTYWDINTKKSEYTPVIFKNGKLVATGWSSYKQLFPKVNPNQPTAVGEFIQGFGKGLQAVAGGASQTTTDGNYYKVNVTGIESGKYKVDGHNVIIDTTMCIAVAIGEEAILKYEANSYDNKLIFPDSDITCDVESVYRTHD